MPLSTSPFEPPSHPARCVADKAQRSPAFAQPVPALGGALPGAGRPTPRPSWLRLHVFLVGLSLEFHPLSLCLAPRLNDCRLCLPNFTDLLCFCLSQEDLLHPGESGGQGQWEVPGSPLSPAWGSVSLRPPLWQVSGMRDPWGQVPWPSGSGLEEGTSTGSQRPQWRGDLPGCPLCQAVRPLNLMVPNSVFLTTIPWEQAGYPYFPVRKQAWGPQAARSGGCRWQRSWTKAGPPAKPYFSPSRDLLYTVGLGLSGAAHGGDEFLVSAQDLLRLHGTICFLRCTTSISIFLPDLLLLTRPLQLISQLGLSRLWRGGWAARQRLPGTVWALSPKPGTPRQLLTLMLTSSLKADFCSSKGFRLGRQSWCQP